MPHDKKSYFRIVSIVTVAVVAAISFLPLKNWGVWYVNQILPAPYEEDDEPLVEAAMRDAFGQDVDIRNMKRTVYPVVVDLDRMKCVGLNLRRGVYGRSQTVCFSKIDGSVVVRYLGQ